MLKLSTASFVLFCFSTSFSFISSRYMRSEETKKKCLLWVVVVVFFFFLTSTP